MGLRGETGDRRDKGDKAASADDCYFGPCLPSIPFLPSSLCFLLFSVLVACFLSFLWSLYILRLCSWRILLLSCCCCCCCCCFWRLSLSGPSSPVVLSAAVRGRTSHDHVDCHTRPPSYRPFAPPKPSRPLDSTSNTALVTNLFCVFAKGTR